MRRWIFPLVILLAAGAAASAHAATYTWSAVTETNWMTTSAWTPTYSGSFSAGDTFEISSGTATANTGTFTDTLKVLAGGTLRVSVNSVTAPKLFLAGGTLSSTSGTTQISNPTTASQWITVDDVDATSAVTSSTINVTAGDLYLNSKFNAGSGGSGNLVKTGAGTLRFNGTQTGGTWAGIMTIDAGRVRLESNTTALGSGTLRVDGDELDISSFNAGTVRILAGGVANITQNTGRLLNLRLDGGTLQAANNWNVGDASTTSKIYVDSASTLKSATTNQYFTVYSQLNGSGALSVQGPGSVRLGYNTSSATYSGTITLDTGDILRMANSNGLCGGTIDVTSGGTFQLGEGFSNGTVNVQTGGVAEADVGGERVATALRLKGGTLLGKNNGAFVGNSASTIHADNDSIIRTDTAVTSGNWLYVRAKLSGSGTLTIQNATAGSGVQLGYGTSNTAFANGKILVDTGAKLRMENANALSGGTVELGSTSGLFQLGAGFTNGKVVANAGGIVEADNSGGWGDAAQLRLNGGTLRSQDSNATYYMGNNNANSKLWIDSTSTIKASYEGQNFYIGAQLNGSGNVQIAGPGWVQLYNTYTGGDPTYSGEISVLSGGKLRMAQSAALSGGTVRLSNSAGLFRLGEGWSTGKVIVDAGGIAEADMADWRDIAELRLNGGTLRSVPNSNSWYGVGTYWNSSKLYVDSTSTIESSNAGYDLNIGARLYGSGNLQIAGPGWVQLYNTVTSDDPSYSGEITVGEGKLRMAQSAALSGGTIRVNNSAGLFRLGEGWTSGKVVVQSGGIAEADTNDWRVVKELRLSGGTLRSVAGSESDYIVGQYWNDSSAIYVDSSSTIQASFTDRSLTIAAPLNGSGNLQIAGPGIVQLRSDVTGTTYSGQIGVAANGILRMGANTGLAGGTVRLTTAGGVFRLGEGFSNGVVYVSANGTAEADHSEDRIAKELRLDGGTLRSYNADSDYRVGDNTTNGMIYIDQASTIQATRTGYRFWLSSKLTGSETITKTGAGSLYFNSVSNNAATYSGAWNIQAGTVEISNPNDGSWQGENLGSGATVNVGTGAFLTFTDNWGDNAWRLTKDFTGTGTVRLTETSDRLVVTRNSGNSVGSIAPGGSGGTGTLTFNWNTTVNTNSQLDFAVNASNQRPVWNIQAVDGLTYDKVVSNGYLANLSNAKLVVDPTVPIPETMTIYESTSAQNLVADGQTFGEVQWLYDTTGTITYGTSGTITIANILPVLWTESNGTWGSSGTGGWDRLNPGYNTMAEIRNGGTSAVDGSRSVRNLVIKNTGSRMNVNEFGSVSATNNIDVQAGGRLDVNSGGYVTAPILTTAGTVNLNTGSSGNITSLTVTDGTTSIGTGTGFFYTNINVTGGSYYGGTLNIDNATSNVTSLVVGTTGQYAASATITNSTVTAGSVAVRKSSGSWNPTKLTVGTGGLLKLADTSKYVADANSYSTGRYVLDPGGEIRFNNSIDLGTFQAQTEWNGGVLGVVSTLTNYNGRSLTANQVVDFGAYGSLDYGPTDRLYLRGGEVRFGSGYARTAQLQLTEDLGTIAVSGGALSNMPKSIPASLKLTGAAATWALSANTTMTPDTVLTLKDGAAVTVGSGRTLSLDSLVFTGTGGNVALGGGTLIHGSSKLQMSAGASITGAGNLLVGSAGVSLGNGGVLQGASLANRLVIYGDVSGSGTLSRTRVYGNINIGNSPGVAFLDGVEWFGPSTTTIELGGTSPGTAPNYLNTQYDRFILQGDGLFIYPNVTAAVVWYNGFQATAGDYFQIFTFDGGTLNGTTFTSLTLPTFTDPNLSWNTSNLYTTGRISVVSAVPEPATLALLGCGSLFVMARWVRRSRRKA